MKTKRTWKSGKNKRKKREQGKVETMCMVKMSLCLGDHSIWFSNMVWAEALDCSEWWVQILSLTLNCVGDKTRMLQDSSLWGVVWNNVSHWRGLLVPLFPHLAYLLIWDEMKYLLRLSWYGRCYYHFMASSPSRNPVSPLSALPCTGRIPFKADCFPSAPIYQSLG